MSDGLVWRRSVRPDVGGCRVRGRLLLVARRPPRRHQHGPAKRLADGVERITYTDRADRRHPRPEPDRLQADHRRRRAPVEYGWIIRMKPDLVWASGPRKGYAATLRPRHVPPRRLPQPLARRRDLGPPGRWARRRRSMDLPEGYGYRYDATDHWILNDMIHNLTRAADEALHPVHGRLHPRRRAARRRDMTAGAADLDGRPEAAASTRSSTSTGARAARTGSSILRSTSEPTR